MVFTRIHVKDAETENGEVRHQEHQPPAGSVGVASGTGIGREPERQQLRQQSDPGWLRLQGGQAVSIYEHFATVAFMAFITTIAILILFL
jgi:hypothetical protein